jgi:hypothetical protein
MEQIKEKLDAALQKIARLENAASQQQQVRIGPCYVADRLLSI